MTLAEIEDHLSENRSWKKAAPALKEAFATTMQDKHYGYGPTNQAWFFYHDGWMAGMRNAGYS